MMLILGLIALFLGVILMILGQMWALVLFLMGFALMAAHFATMFRGAGYRAEGAFFNGLNGQGRQQSEVGKDPTIPQDYEDRPANK